MYQSDFEMVLKLEPGNKQAINEVTKLRNVSVFVSFCYYLTFSINVCLCVFCEF